MACEARMLFDCPAEENCRRQGWGVSDRNTVLWEGQPVIKEAAKLEVFFRKARE